MGLWEGIVRRTLRGQGSHRKGYKGVCRVDGWKDPAPSRAEKGEITVSDGRGAVFLFERQKRGENTGSDELRVKAW